jgi:polysaccharide export outer membrane protein
MLNVVSSSAFGDMRALLKAEFPWTLRGWKLLIVIACFTTLCGCHGPNHFYARDSVFGKRLPDGLRLAQTSNPQTVDLSRLASGTGGSETIGVGDVLEVQIAAGLSEDDQATMAARVANDGSISLPMIGVLNVAGVEPQGAESLIRSEAIRRQLYHNPTVTVTVTHQRMNKVRVLGAVKAPGLYELPPNASDVVSAIAAAQGLEKDAGQKVEVRNPFRANPVNRPAVADVAGHANGLVSGVSSTSSLETGMNSYSIDLISAAKAGDGQYVVHDGGVVMVEKRDPAPVYVGGLVRSAGRYDYPIGQDLHLLDAIALAGGMSNQLANKIYVVRPVVGSKDPAVIEISYRDAKQSADSNIRLGPGDVVSVEHTPGTVFMEALNLIRFGVSGNTSLF